MIETMSTQGQTSVQEEAILRDLLGVVHRRWRIILITVALSLGVAWTVSRVIPPVYRATSTLVADKSPPQVLLNAQGLFSFNTLQPVGQAPDAGTLAELTRSAAVRRAAVARLTPILDSKQADELLTKKMVVDQVRNSELVRISVDYKDPDIAAAAANTVSDSVVEFDLNARRRLATAAREFLSKQRDLASQKLEASQAALVTFKSRNQQVALTEETTLNLQQLASLKRQVLDVRLQQREARARMQASGAGLARLDGGAAPQGTVINSLQSQLDALEIELAGERQQFTPSHPAVKSTEAKIAETRNRLSAEIARSQTALDTREQTLSTSVTALEHKLRSVPGQEAELARLVLDVKEAQQSYELFLEKFQEAQIAEGSIGSAVRVVDVAKPPRIPVWPRWRLNMIVGAVLGLMLGVTASIVSEQLDDTVHSSEEVERVLGAPVLGTAPMLPARDGKRGWRRNPPPLISQFGWGSVPAETFRVLRTHVLASMPRAGSKCLLITSALPREGKSTVAANLAITLAQTGCHVLLVDCDLRRPAIGSLFPEAQSQGLSALLAGQVTVDRVVRPTAQPHLSCVTSGSAVPNPAELLDANTMAQFITEARAQADVIVLDSPAVLPVTDAQLLGGHADAVLVVVRMGQTERRALVALRQRLERVGMRVLGVVLNNVAPGEQDGYKLNKRDAAYYATPPKGREA